MKTIDSFTGKYAFLSNFYLCDVNVRGMTFPSGEHAFQALKTISIFERRQIQKQPTPYEAKRLGNKRPPNNVGKKGRPHGDERPYTFMRPNWNEVKIDEMTLVVRSKFEQNPDLMRKLLATGNALLVEGNNWHDTFWGRCNGGCRRGAHFAVGKNHLGKILMMVREEYS